MQTSSVTTAPATAAVVRNVGHPSCDFELEQHLRQVHADREAVEPPFRVLLARVVDGERPSTAPQHRPRRGPRPEPRRDSDHRADSTHSFRTQRRAPTDRLHHRIGENDAVESARQPLTGLCARSRAYSSCAVDSVLPQSWTWMRSHSQSLLTIRVNVSEQSGLETPSRGFRPPEEGDGESPAGGLPGSLCLWSEAVVVR